uniref:Uncharacterized protein n=1 Tax=Kalanchoe fedtschenkoi TaxID=63787 RepID=A0A7N0ZVE1_KALFE
MEEYSSSGCESGWTFYFEQSRGCVDYDNACVNRWDEEDDEEESEDSSMLSDASSGPAQLSHDSPTNCQTNDNSWSFGNGGGGLFCSTDEGAAALAKRPKRGKRADDQQLLDDTASSSPDYSGHSYSSSMNNDHRRHSRHHRSSPMDFSEDHLSSSYFQVPICP